MFQEIIKNNNCFYAKLNVTQIFIDLLNRARKQKINEKFVGKSHIQM